MTQVVCLCGKCTDMDEPQAEEKFKAHQSICELAKRAKLLDDAVRNVYNRRGYASATMKYLAKLRPRVASHLAPRYELMFTEVRLEYHRLEAFRRLLAGMGREADVRKQPRGSW